MEIHTHDMRELFQQLGLPSDQEGIDEFISRHRCLCDGIALTEAPFWNESQAEFLREAVAEDSDWSELVDQLDVRLRY